jgi:signal recognition particle subunit SRP54
MDEAVDLPQLVHRHFIDVEPAGSIEDDSVQKAALGEGDGITADIDRVRPGLAVDRSLDLFAEHFELFDGGGAALSIKEVTQVPIKWVGMGEKLDRLEPFRPEGLASRILGQGDLMSLVDKVGRVQQELSQEEIERQQKKLQEGDFSLDDFRKQFEQLAKMGSMRDIIGSMPGMSEMLPEGEDPEQALKRIQGMIDSMTKEEKRNPDLIDGNRRRRIARGSGTEPQEVNQFLKQFDMVRGVMRQMAKMSMWERLKMVTGMSKAGAFMPGAKMLKTKIGTGHRKSATERAEERKKKRKQNKRKK